MAKVKKEKTGIASITMGGIGNVMSYLIVSNLTYCLTESAAMAAGTVGTIFLVSRLFDGVTDLIAGYIIDHTNTKWGKARPFDLVTIPLWLFIVLCFSVPGLSNVGKVIWVAVTYNLSQSVCYTLVNGAYPVRLKRSIKEEHYVKAMSIGSFANTIVSLAVSILMPVLIAVFEDMSFGWTIISSIYAVVGISLTLTQFFTLKELDAEEDAEQKTISSDKLSVKESVRILFQNPYVFISAAAFIMLSVVNNLSAVANYYFTYVIGNIALASIVGLISVLGMGCVLFLPALQKRIGSRGAVVTGLAALAAGNFAKIVMPTNVLWISICTAIASGGQVLVGGMRNIINIDCMNYGKRKSGVEMEGLYACVNGFGDKIGLGLGSFLVGSILELGGYDGQLAVQSASAIASIKFVYIGVPAICAVIGIILIMFYNEKVVKNIEKV
ncbi:MAG: glycoside-pentoside-hexuronide (GPH):cation symporter [Lachnospiraceae bacterium]|nr:glycoside-pentoside-hexuronide (GPH):cation symporter [Lachnospiraceae bacterium]